MNDEPITDLVPPAVEQYLVEIDGLTRIKQVNLLDSNP